MNRHHYYRLGLPRSHLRHGVGTAAIAEEPGWRTGRYYTAAHGHEAAVRILAWRGVVTEGWLSLCQDESKGVGLSDSVCLDHQIGTDSRTITQRTNADGKVRFIATVRTTSSGNLKPRILLLPATFPSARPGDRTIAA